MNWDRLAPEHEADFGVVLDLLLPSLKRTDERFVILIDGGSGSGKTTLAVSLQTSLVTLGQPAQLVSLDDCYPGWGGLAEASRMVIDDILDPAAPGYQRWDWENDRPANWVTLDPDRPLIVEGCGALTPLSAAYATLAVWVHRDPIERREAALARDGHTFGVHWDQWAKQEYLHWSTYRPWNLAGLVCVVGPG